MMEAEYHYRRSSLAVGNPTTTNTLPQVTGGNYEKGEKFERTKKIGKTTDLWNPGLEEKFAFCPLPWVGFVR